MEVVLFNRLHRVYAVWFQILLFSTSVRFSTKTLAYLAYMAYEAHKAFMAFKAYKASSARDSIRSKNTAQPQAAQAPAVR